LPTHLRENPPKLVPTRHPLPNMSYGYQDPYYDNYGDNGNHGDDGYDEYEPYSDYVEPDHWEPEPE
jgi:hypothetical protein